MRVAVTGAGGRLGQALMAAFGNAPFTGPSGPRPWSRPEYDLDDLRAAGRLVARDQPEVVVHAAAWTDVDGCARHPRLASRRNAEATEALAQACVAAGSELLLVSTNEVFDGRRADGQGYGANDRVGPINPYGESKLAGERAARAAFSRARVERRLGIVRTAWLFGPPGDDFPTKILAAAERASRIGEPLRVVGDEIGSPTFAPDLAEAIVELVGSGRLWGIRHVVNDGVVSRADWAREVLRDAGVDLPIEDIPSTAWPRASTPPAWAVLASDVPLRSWREALSDYLPDVVRSSLQRSG